MTLLKSHCKISTKLHLITYLPHLPHECSNEGAPLSEMHLLMRMFAWVPTVTLFSACLTMVWRRRRMVMMVKAFFPALIKDRVITHYFGLILLLIFTSQNIPKSFLVASKAFYIW